MAAMPVATDVPRVLIVDDQGANLDALEAMLEPLQCTSVRALSADEALLCLLRDDFAAIVLDIRMPGMNGIDLARLIKQRKRSQHIPILFLTAHLADDADVLRGYGAGAVDYLSKPINADILRSKVGVFVDLFRTTRAFARVNEALQEEVAERHRAEAALQRANQELEMRVQERTAALARAHEGVRQNEERLRMAMEIGQIAAWEWNLTTGRMTWSTDPEALFGLPTGALGPEQRLFSVLHPEDRGRVESTIHSAVMSGAYDVEYRILRPDGSVVWVTERGRVVTKTDGPAEKMVGVSRDVSSRREAEAERERLLGSARDALAEAERHSRLKDDFLATLSHELRTPLNMILGWLDILRSGKQVRNIGSALDVIQRNAQIQAKLIEDLLDMNRLVSGTITLEMTVIDVGIALRNAMQGLQPAADAKGVRLVAESIESAPHVVADARRLQQVLWNLLHNAIKFTQHGGRVDITFGQADDMLEITVRDNGCGISTQFLPHVFERFRQESSAPADRSPGLGLGLSIARHLVELHGGTISALSDGPGTGAAFVVRLPTSRSRSGPDDVHPARDSGSLRASA